MRHERDDSIFVTLYLCLAFYQVQNEFLPIWEINYQKEFFCILIFIKIVLFTSSHLKFIHFKKCKIQAQKLELLFTL